MSWTRIAALLSAVALVASATTARAADQEYGRSGPFVGAGGAYAFENFDVSGVKFDDSWGYYVKGGYRFNEWFALELDWEHYLAFDDNAGSGDTNIWMIGLNGKFYPFHGIVQPYALFGADYAKVDPSNAARDNGGDKGDSNVAFRFAGGLEVYATRNWAFSADVGYFLPTGKSSDYGIVPITFGVLYRFY
ncbi:MAG TPA: porin family protein [Candidatus Limnocylindrales bacterium]|nr:porin family protein [Candidatus Limnocylindrales bacterium]